MLDEQSSARVVPGSYRQAKDGTAGAAALKHYDVLTAAYPEASCFVFRKSSTFRKACVHVSHSKAFENFIFFIIICNCVTLALSSSRQDFDRTRLGQVIIKIDYAFIAIFTLEMILKIVSMGFVLKKGTYLRDGWNVLDFLVVIFSYLGLIQAHNLTGLRTVRALRPLRAIRRIRGMQVLVTTMIGSLPMLFDVFALCAFTFFMFGIVAVQLFAGVLRNRCGTPDFSSAYNVTLPSSSTSNSGSGVGGSGLGASAAGTVVLANVSYEVPDDQSEDMCSGPLSSEVVWYPSDEQPVALPGKLYAGRHCSDGMYCAPYGNPYDGFVGYDNILWSWLTIFQHITLSGWTDVMYMVMDAVNYWVWIFYVGLIIFGAFFMVNLALAVLSVNFSSDNLKQLEEEEQRQVAPANAAEAVREGEAGDSGPGVDEAGSSLGGYLLAPVSISNVMARLRARKSRPGDEDDPTVATGTPPPPELGRLRRLVWRLAVSKGLELTTAALIAINIAVMCVNWYGMPSKVEQATNYINYALTGYFAVELVIRISAFGFVKFFRVGMNIFDFIVVVLSLVEMIIDLLPSMSGLGPLSVLRAFRLLRIFRLARNWKEFDALIRGMFRSVKASIMLVGLMLLFLFISSLIGMQLFGYEFMFCDYVEGAKAVCPPGQRVWGECPNHFYCYLPCSKEQNGTWVDAPGSFYNGLAYCDSFCASAGDAAGSGCEYLAMVGKSQVPRANFDNVLWGIYTVFQLLTGEDWNTVMYNGMSTVSDWASLYFVGAIVIGNYLVFNLFIAILLDNLSFKIEETASSGHNKLKGDDDSSTSSSCNGEGKDEEAEAEAEAEEPLPLAPAGKQSPGAAAAPGGAPGPASIVHDKNAVAAEVKPAGKSRTSFQSDRGQAGGEGDNGNRPVTAHHLQASAGKGSSDQRPVDGANDVATVASTPPAPNRPDREQQCAPLPPLPPRSTGTATADSGAVQGNVLSRASAVAEASEVPSRQPSPGLLSPDGPEMGTEKAHTSARNLLPALQLAASAPKLRWDDSVIMAAAGAPAASAADYSYTDRMQMNEHGKYKERKMKQSTVSESGTASQVFDMHASRATSKASLDVLAREATIGSWQHSGRDVSVSRIPRHSSKSVLAQLKSLGSFAALHPMRPPWQNTLEGRALLLFGPESGLRSSTATLVHSPLFETVIMVLIMASCVSLVLDSPGLDPHSRLAMALRIMDYIFLGAFTLEAVLKIVTFGFAFSGKHAYVRSGWNLLDFFVVLLGWALIIIEEVGVSGQKLTVLRVLRALRALRLLRAVHRFPGLRMVVSALFAVLPSMINVALVCVFFYLIFAILAVNLFKGELFNCIDAASGERIDPFYVMPPGKELTRAWCEAGKQTISQSAYHSRINLTIPEYTMQTEWDNPANNFDNVGVALLTLFQAATLSMWVDITFSAVDSVGVDKQPLWNHTPWVILIFILFIVVCSFFVLNLFIGVTLEKFAELHEAAQGTTSLDLTPQQQTWVDVQNLLIRTRMQYKPPRPHNRLRGFIYVVVSHNLFDLFMLLVIITNVAFMAMVHWNMSSTWQGIMSYSNLTFTCIFFAEAFAKIVAFGPLGYLRDGWNRFDFIVVLASVASVVLDYSDTRNVSFMPVLRVLRVARVVRLIRNATGMQKLLRTLFDSLPALANVGGAMLLFFFMFAIIGVNLFAGIKYGDNLNLHANFDNFPNAMLLLFRMITGEGWNGIMLDCMQTHDCRLVLQDINITTTTSSPTASNLSSSLANATISTVITLLAGTYLDPSDPLLSSLPSNATQNQCPLTPVAAAVYFPIFVVLCTFILLQLVIAVLLENLTQAEADAELPISKSCIDSFVDAWSNLDGTATGFIHASQLVSLVCLTEPPLGTAGRFNSWIEAQELLFQMDIPLYQGHQVSFIEVLYSLSGAVCGAALPEAVETKLVDELSKRAPQMEPWGDHTAGHYHAAISVAAAIRGFLLRHAYRDLLGNPVVTNGADPLGTTAVAALAATRFRSRAITAGAADSNMLVNGQRLSDLRRELAADNINNSEAVRRPRPGVLARLPPIAPLRAHRGPDPAGLLSARALHSPMPSKGKEGKLPLPLGPGRPGSEVGQWAPGRSQSSGRVRSLPPMRPRSSSGQQQQQRQEQGEPPPSSQPPSGAPLTPGLTERRPDRVSSAPAPTAAGPAAPDPDPDPSPNPNPAGEVAPAPPAPAPAEAAAMAAGENPASSLPSSSISTSPLPPRDLGSSSPSTSASQQLPRHSLDETPRRKIILPSLAGYTPRSGSAGTVSGTGAGANGGGDADAGFAK
ncbi:hypothetical protein VaNZ11_016896 [Volvox africanus]|uniref:Voltage-gated Ca2+ channel, alpha subunit n=1 Tax=Volvox africanus TaxID=51714 RepID=A0ABQ5SPS5_9CHLO|nr:hypothetical protein VaNZ11_016896 [Volvox africanus]